jgi:hypothetical protein
VKVLIACEYSGRTRRAFAALGHDVISADFEPAEDNSPYHYQGDCFDLINDHQFDLMIAHPPCTYLAVSGIHWNSRGVMVNGRPRAELTEEALEFVRRLMDAPIPRIAIENPVSVISSRIRKPDQIIQPWMFGEDASKATCLWLKGLPLLKPTNIIEGKLYCCGIQVQDDDKYACPNCNGAKKAKRIYGNQTPSGQNKLGPSDNRWKERSRTYEGVAAAWASQWGDNSISGRSECGDSKQLCEPAVRDLFATDLVSGRVACAEEGGHLK